MVSDIITNCPLSSLPVASYCSIVAVLIFFADHSRAKRLLSCPNTVVYTTALAHWNSCSLGAVFPLNSTNDLMAIVSFDASTLDYNSMVAAMLVGSNPKQTNPMYASVVASVLPDVARDQHRDRYNLRPRLFVSNACIADVDDALRFFERLQRFLKVPQ